MTGFWARLLGREPVPDAVADALADSEAVATAQAPDGMLVVTSWGIWPPGGERLGWHEIAKATWDKTSLVVCSRAASRSNMGCTVCASGANASRRRRTIAAHVTSLFHALFWRSKWTCGGHMALRATSWPAAKVASFPMMTCGRSGWISALSHMNATCVR